MTLKPPTVHLANPGDEDLLFSLVCSSDNEWALCPQDTAKVRSVIHLATHGGPPPRPVFGVVRGASVIEGAVGLFPTEPWNSSQIYLRAFYHFVAPEYRKSRHAVELMAFAGWFGEVAGMPVLYELLHPERTEAKARLFGRRAIPVGGLFLHAVARAAEVAA